MALSEFAESAEERNTVELSCDDTFKAQFSRMELTELLSAKAKRILIPFAASYLCEAEISSVAVLKNMWLAVSIRFVPIFEKLRDEETMALEIMIVFVL